MDLPRPLPATASPHLLGPPQGTCAISTRGRQASYRWCITGNWGTCAISARGRQASCHWCIIGDLRHQRTRKAGQLPSHYSKRTACRCLQTPTTGASRTAAIKLTASVLPAPACSPSAAATSRLDALSAPVQEQAHNT